MKKSYNKIEESPHARALRAERTLISITLPMAEDELTLFLDEIGCERMEYDYLLQKHSRLVDRWKEETQNKE